eukprot:365902-Chlamydomonas_euryale.AAC.1
MRLLRPNLPLPRSAHTPSGPRRREPKPHDDAILAAAAGHETATAAGDLNSGEQGWKWRVSMEGTQGEGAAGRVSRASGSQAPAHAMHASA